MGIANATVSIFNEGSWEDKQKLLVDIFVLMLIILALLEITLNPTLFK